MIYVENSDHTTAAMEGLLQMTGPGVRREKAALFHIAEDWKHFIYPK
jgi:hypothetical protein